jgi:hypothetical protein
MKLINLKYLLAFLRYSCFVLLINITSCKKLVDIKPPVTNVTGSTVYASDATAAAVMTGIYSQISANYYYTIGVNSLSMRAGLSADELTLWNGVTDPVLASYYTNTLSVHKGGWELWPIYYNYIYICNAAIQGLTASTQVSTSVKQQLLGEAKFVRAFCYFHLVNLYGDVPLVLGTDYKQNALVSRTPEISVYAQMVTDLKDAQNLLDSVYLDGSIARQTSERTRPTKWVATALLARVFLYQKNWKDAQMQAASVINNSNLYALTDLNSVFLANSTEAIWQLQPVDADVSNTQEGALFVLPDSGPNAGVPGNPVYLSNSLLNSFEPNDQRRTEWVDSVIVASDTFYFPYKYKINALFAPVTEYEMMFRLSEQYLIKAEAEAQLNDLTDAAFDLNAIRVRAGLPQVSSLSQSDMLTTIAHERQVELFTEWGARWMDLKRTGAIENVMSVAIKQKGGTWNSYQQLYPIPLTDVQEDPNLKQNDGY